MIIDETERLIIKEIEPADYLQAAFFFAEINTENATASAGTVYDLAFVKKYCETAYGFYGYGYYGVYLKTGEIIGLAGFREGSCPVEVGFIIDDKYRGQGYASEAVKSLTEWVHEDFLWVVEEEKPVGVKELAERYPDKFLYFQKSENAVLIYAVTDRENFGAQKVLEANGYELYKGV